MDYIAQHCLIPSRIENFTVIMDFKDIGSTGVPKKLIKGITHSMAQNFRGRLFRCYGVNCPWLVRGFWAIAKPLVSEFTIRKIIILGEDHKEALLNTIPEEHLEERFGGKLANKTSHYFPPDLY